MRFLHPPCSAPDPSADAGTLVGPFRATPGLYVHVPFCRRICPFCPYWKVLWREDLARRYVAALDREADLALAVVPPPYASLYVGGGTPTLALDLLEPVLRRLPVRGERAIEVLPSHAVPATLDALAAMGFTHVSLGVQSFDPRVLRHLGRPGSPEENLAALRAARGRFACVDVDLIFDHAFGDPDAFLRDVLLAVQEGADQVSTYPLMRFRRTPFGKGRHRPGVEHRVLRQAEALVGRRGWERRAVWTFHRRGSPGYTSITRETYLGLGAGAATFTGHRFLVNHFSLARHAEAVEGGRLPVARRIDLTGREAALFHLFWQTYTGRVDLARFADLYPRERRLAAGLRLLEPAGLLRRRGRFASLTPRGHDAFHDLERAITYRLIEPLWEEMTREA